MIYHLFLTVHSLLRWVVLFFMLYILIQSIRQVKIQKSYSKWDLKMISVSVIVIYTQAFLGLILYFVSPIVKQFYANPSTFIHIRETRFFSIEHSLMMIVAIVVYSIGVFKSKKVEDARKPKIIVKWLLVALLIILLNIPWEFSPLVHRPSLRWL